jgi:hypothetical protein
MRPFSLNYFKNLIENEKSPEEQKLIEIEDNLKKLNKILDEKKR